MAQVNLSLGSASASPGSTVTLNLAMNATGAAPAAVQWTFGYSSANIVSVQAVAGAAATAAGKTLYCSSGTGTYTCLLVGLNANTIGNGTLAAATFQLAAAPSGSSIPVSVSGPVSASGTGNALTTTAAGGTIAVTVPVTVVPSALSCTPSSFTAAGSSTCTVTLNAAAPSGGASVALSDNSPSVTVPASVTVAAGATSATFTATVAAVTTDATARITATLNGTSASASLSLAAPASLSALSCNPTTIAAGATSTCTVTLTKAAPSGGFAVSLSDNSSYLSSPSSVTVAAGATSATFTATAGTPATQQSATITASANGVSRSITVTVQAQLRVSGLSCTPSSFTGAGSASCTVTLNNAAPAGGVSVALSSNSAYVTVPASVNVAAGATSAGFAATVGAPPASTTAQVTATLNGGSATATFSLTVPAAALSSLACNPTTLAAGASSGCTVTISAPAPPGGMTVTLSSSSSVLTVPASVTIAAGAVNAAFTAVAGPPSAAQNATATATANGVSLSVTFTIQATSSSSTFTIWPATVVPSQLHVADPTSLELGVKFRSDVAGYIHGIRFYKGVQNAGTHTGSLWTREGVRLASGVFTGETTEGWQEVRFASPVAIAANTTYVASYHTSTGFARTVNQFVVQGQDSPPLHALKNNVDGCNGLYVASPTVTFPSGCSGSNYWVDVVFATTAADPPPTPTPAQSIWPATAVPTQLHVADPTSLELGVKFRSDVAGYIHGIRFYKGAQNTGTHTGSLWTREGVQLASGVFTSETAAGWQEMRFASPVAIVANTTYVASYHTSTGFSKTVSYFLGEGQDSPPLHALKNNVDGCNGLYVASPTVTFPSGCSGSNYWVDVVFAASPTSLAAPGASELTVWSASATPAQVHIADPGSVELGMKFRSDLAGFIHGIRFYKGSLNTGPHTGSLWTRSGTLLATGTFTGETAEGWQEMRFTAPVAIDANTTYVASYHTSTGFARTVNYFPVQGQDSPPLHALKDGVDGCNGLYMYSSTTTFPAACTGSNYWVDVVFSTSATPPPQ